MDSKLFNLPTSHVSKPSMTAGLPTEDSRFPGWAAVMTDGRLVTDYRSSRETNIPVRAQEKTRIWLQQNADEIIRISRTRAAQNTGMIYGLDKDTLVPAASFIKCSAATCQRTEGALHGIGTERIEETPYLFGTYEAPIGLRMAPSPKTPLTRHSEGGRNSQR
jgi:hypothetical protein